MSPKELLAAREETARACAHRAMRDFIHWKELTEDEWEARLTSDAKCYAAPGGPLAPMDRAVTALRARIAELEAKLASVPT